jgi:hypothetical protein
VKGRVAFRLPSGLAVGKHRLTVAYSGSDVVAPSSVVVTVSVAPQHGTGHRAFAR